MRQKLYILDVSGYIFRAYFALPPMSNAKGIATHGLFGFIRSILKFRKEWNPTHIVAVYDGPDNKKTRRDIYDKYKANRQTIQVDLPGQIEWSKEFCKAQGISCIEIPAVEADDAMGSIATWAAQKGFEVYLCTGDKDLCQLVNDQIFVMNPWKDFMILDRKKVEEIYGVPPEQIVDLLAILGDSSDNIPGVKGFGPKTTVPLLQEFGSLENILANLDQIKGEKKKQILLEERDNALLSKKLACIDTQVAFPCDEKNFELKPIESDLLYTLYSDWGFSSLTKEHQKSLPQLPLSIQIIENASQLEHLIKSLLLEKEICFNIQGTDPNPFKSEIMGVCLCTSENAVSYIPFNASIEKTHIQQALKTLFENPACSFYGHNIKYECHLLASIGITIIHPSFDTMLASYLLHSESRRHLLDQLALKYFEKTIPSFKSLLGSGKKSIPIDQVPTDQIAAFAAEILSVTYKLKIVLEKEISERKLDSLLFDLELPLMKVLVKMEQTGIFLDVEYLKSMQAAFEKDLAALTSDIYALAGCEFNLNSPKQLASVLFETLQIKSVKKTATGHSTNADVLEVLAKTHPIAKKILDYRASDKLLSTYIAPLPLIVSSHTKRIHPNFNQSVAATGRLSCQDPNLQNIPIKTELGRKIREAFHPQQAHASFLAADYSQIELRLLAHLSEDENLIHAFCEGEDIHQFTASLILGIPYSEITKNQRNQAKAINFGIIYGQQAYGLSQELGIDIHEAGRFIDAYFERYPKVYSFIQRSIESVQKSGKSITMMGREREIPEINSNNAFLRANAMRLAINTPLQGSAADLIKLAMLEIDRLLLEAQMESKMILQIHDELIFEVPDHELESLETLVKQAMTRVFTLKVPLVVDVTIGKNWGEC